jgi:hypothetical protein
MVEEAPTGRTSVKEHRLHIPFRNLPEACIGFFRNVSREARWTTPESFQGSSYGGLKHWR